MGAGSSGPTILIMHGFITILVFLTIGREYYITMGLVALIMLSLFFVELRFPELIKPFHNEFQKSANMFSVVVFFILMEIPVLLYARNNLYKERNDALAVAERKSTLLANISHEIRTPMNAIIGFTELMNDPDIKKEEIKSYLQIVNQNSRTLMNLLNNAINITKLDSGITQVYYCDYNVNRGLSGLHETLKLINPNPEVNIEVEYLQDNLEGYRTDENLLFKILLNISFNAIKFTQRGEVRIKAVKQEDSLLFQVSDTGCGIPEDMHANLFERFKQANDHIKANPGNGAGIGLAICKGLTELLNGNIWFESEIGVGTQFYVKLPLDPGKYAV